MRVDYCMNIGLHVVITESCLRKTLNSVSSDINSQKASVATFYRGLPHSNLIKHQLQIEAGPPLLLTVI